MIFETDEDFLEHYGVKGMKWGQRKATPTGASHKVNKEASKDAKEYARSKMFYGDGAGNRRKLINAKVEEKSKRIEGYKKAFDHHVQTQDMSKHSDKAVKERRSTDRKIRNKQRAGAAARRVTGEMGTQAAFVALTAGGIAFARSSKGQALMNQAVSKAKDARARKRTADFLNDLLRNMR
jgi:hypothetical protein